MEGRTAPQGGLHGKFHNALGRCENALKIFSKGKPEAVGEPSHNARGSVAKSPVFKRACPFKRAFGENRPFFARFFVILPVFLCFWSFRTVFAMLKSKKPKIK